MRRVCSGRVPAVAVVAVVVVDCRDGGRLLPLSRATSCRGLLCSEEDVRLRCVSATTSAWWDGLEECEVLPLLLLLLQLLLRTSWWLLGGCASPPPPRDGTADGAAETRAALPVGTELEASEDDIVNARGKRIGERVERGANEDHQQKIIF